MPSLLLHSENLLRIPFRGGRTIQDIEKRAQETKAATQNMPVSHDVGITVLIRTKNDADTIANLLDDVRANQEYFAGPVQIVLVDTESTDDTVAIARKYDKFFEVTVVPIKQSEFNYATSLNVGFRAAKYEFVYTLVGHSALVTRVALLAARKYANMQDFAGAFCWPLPNAGASMTERWGTLSPLIIKQISGPAHEFPKPMMGIMGANCSLVRRSVWQKLNGYDERYGAGGEDGDFGVRALAAGHKVFVEPAIAVYHSHGVGPIAAIQQFMYWSRIGKPYAFDAKRLTRFRRDLRAKLK